MANPLLTRNISIVLDGSTLLCPDSFSMKGSGDSIEITCMGTTGWKRSIPDMKSWTASFSGTVYETTGHAGVGVEDLWSKFTVGASVGVFYLPDASANFYLTGDGFLTSVSIDLATGAPAKYSAEISGDDALSAAFTN